MDADVVNIAYEKVTPEVVFMQEMKAPESVVVRSGDTAYSVDLSAIGNLDKDGRINLSLATLKANEKELIQSMHRSNDEYYRTLASLNQSTASEHEVGKILQYNNGSTKMYDNEYCYIPEDFNKNESLNFMRTYASKIMADGRLEQNDDKVKLAGYMLSLENRLRGDAYNAVNVQSVFNTIAEREPGLMGDKEQFDKFLSRYEKKLYVHRQMVPVFKHYHAHNAYDHTYHPEPMIGGRDGSTPYVIESPQDIQAQMASMFKNYHLHHAYDHTYHPEPMVGGRDGFIPYVVDGPKDIQAEMAGVSKAYHAHNAYDHTYHPEPMVGGKADPTPHVVDMPTEIVFEKKSSGRGRA